MAFFEWNQAKHSVGIPEMDRQHQYLIKLLDDLHQAMYAGEGKAPLGKILDGLFGYTQRHFAAEERLMLQYHYPEYARHRDIHRKMTQRVLEIREDFRRGDITSPVQISNFLKDWLHRHIMETDRRYGEFIAEKRRNFRE